MRNFRAKYGFGRAIAAPQIGEFLRIIYMNFENKSKEMQKKDFYIKLYCSAKNVPEPFTQGELSLMHMQRKSIKKLYGINYDIEAY